MSASGWIIDERLATGLRAEPFGVELLLVWMSEKKDAEALAVSTSSLLMLDPLISWMRELPSFTPRSQDIVPSSGLRHTLSTELTRPRLLLT